MELTDLIHRSKSGDREAQHRLFKTYNQMLFAISKKYAYQTYYAEDILQESWIEIFNSLGNYKHAGNFAGWMKTIVIRKAWRMNQKQSKYKTDSTEKLGLAESVYNMAIEQMTCDELLKVLNDVPNGPQEVFKMYVLDGFKHDEIADILNMNVSTSRSYLARARKFITERFERNNKILSR